MLEKKILNEANILLNSYAKMPEARLIPLKRRWEDSSLQTLMVPERSPIDTDF